MKYFSELTNKLYDDEETLNKEEADYTDSIAKKNKKAKEKEAAWAKVQEAYNKAAEAKKAADQLKSEYYKKYYGDNFLYSILDDLVL